MKTQKKAPKKTSSAVKKKSDIKVIKKSAVKKTVSKTKSVEKKPIKTSSVLAQPKRAASVGPASFPAYEQQGGEDYMNKRQLDYFRDSLNAWNDQLAKERNATVAHMQEDPNNLPDLLDRAALEEEHKIEWQAREMEHRLIIKIERALSRIKQGDYGYCEKCGAEIGLLRLQVRPTATLCIDCKEIDEIREKQTGIVE